MPSWARRALRVAWVAAFLAVHLVNPVLQARSDAAGWTGTELEPKAGRLPYLPRQSWSPSVNDRDAATVRKAEPQRPKLPWPALQLLAAGGVPAGLHPVTNPPALAPETSPAYLLPYLEGTPDSWRSPPL